MSEAATPETASPETMERIQAALDEIRPALQFDGGDAELVDFSPGTGVVQLRLHGACNGCGMSTVTLQAGIERILKERVPEITAVVNV